MHHGTCLRSLPQTQQLPQATTSLHSYAIAMEEPRQGLQLSSICTLTMLVLPLTFALSAPCHNVPGESIELVASFQPPIPGPQFFSLTASSLYGRRITIEGKALGVTPIASLTYNQIKVGGTCGHALEGVVMRRVVPWTVVGLQHNCAWGVTACQRQSVHMQLFLHARIYKQMTNNSMCSSVQACCL